MTMLSIQDITELIEALRETNEFIDTLKRNVEIAKHIQYPKIPTLLSESITGIAIKKGILLPIFGSFRDVSRGGKVADLICTTVSGESINVEVKASGLSNFATFGSKDYGADILIWLLFNDLFRSRTLNSLEVLVCPSPSNNLPWRKDRVTVSQLVKSWNGTLRPKEILLADLYA